MDSPIPRSHLHKTLLGAAAFCLLPRLALPAMAASGAVSGKTGNLALVYGAVAVFSLLLAVGYLLWEKRKEPLFTALFFCVAAANVGYFLQAVSTTLTGALWANRLSYFGSAYLILLMLLIILEVCGARPSRKKKCFLIGISTAAFFLAASGSWHGLYYSAVDITQINGMTRLVKEYGPLHSLYSWYLAAYLAVMVGMILRAANAKRLSAPKYAAFLLSAVLLNLVVWAVEQAVDVDFEFLSLSYILTACFLLLIYGLLRDYGILQSGGQLLSVRALEALTRPCAAGTLPPGMEELFDGFARRVKTLSGAEGRILQYYIEGHETADIPELAFISIHTVKKHNRSIYQKLEVASRDELMLYIELFRCCGRLEELTSNLTDPMIQT